MEIIVSKTIGIGDAGFPFHLVVDVVYEIENSVIIITECIERESPYDNPPESWYTRIREIVDDFFYDTHPNCNIIFK
jgi:hypothetical protein